MKSEREGNGMEMKKPVPVLVLSGFLGSGKTTLLLHLLEQMKQAGLTPGVIMNEIGEISLDGAVVEADVPMNEIMDGCICCSVRGELSLSLQDMVVRQQPDIIIVEATGLANPLELIEGITDTSLVLRAELHSVITVVDGEHFLSLTGEAKSKTSKGTLLLLEDQIRAANAILLNKTDLLTAEQLEQAKRQIRLWNSRAALHYVAYSQVELHKLWQVDDNGARDMAKAARSRREREQAGAEKDAGAAGDACAAEGAKARQAAGGTGVSAGGHLHDHVTVYTHYFGQPLARERFDRFMAALPSEVYRAKGFLTFEESASERTLFQYAYRRISLLSMKPLRPLPDVMVLMGENIPKSRIKFLVEQMEGKTPVVGKGKVRQSARLKTGSITKVEQ